MLDNKKAITTPTFIEDCNKIGIPETEIELLAQSLEDNPLLGDSVAFVKSKGKRIALPDLREVVWPYQNGVSHKLASALYVVVPGVILLRAHNMAKPGLGKYLENADDDLHLLELLKELGEVALHNMGLM